jgi:hypothetical protein
VERFAVALGGAYYGLGSLHGLYRLQPAEALVWYDKSAATLRPVAGRDGPDSPAGRQLHLALFGRAVALGFLKRHEEALRAWDDALAATTGANRPNTVAARRNALAQYADHLATVARGGKPDEATERAKVFDREKDLPGPAALAVARLYAVAGAANPAAAKPHIERGAEWLEAAYKAGAFADPAARKRLAEDKDLEPLRETEAFRRATGEGGKNQ